MNSETSVLIVGAGPVGLALAHCLGRQGVACTVIEREAELSDEPRAVGIDPESLRTFQNLGLLDELADDILFGVGGRYQNGDGELLFELSDTSNGPIGYPYLSSFSQPGLVRVLARELQRYACVDLFFEHEMQSFIQDDAGVSISVLSAAGESTVRASFMVGCDGGRSPVRNALGIRMQGDSNPLPWLVIDTLDKTLQDEPCFRFFCDPARPGMFLQTPHGTRRWEWMLLPGEDREAFLEDETIHQLIAPHVDVSQVDVFRRRVYDFHSIIADRFQEGRVFLAGDAAHMTPPFAGQGFNSGLRDVANLGWKLAAVVAGAPLALLESYTAERWEHAWQLIQMAVQLGNDIQPIDPEKAAERDAGFRLLHGTPGAMDEFEDGVFKALLDRYFTEGAAVGLGSDPRVGRWMQQPVVQCDQESGLLDSFLGGGFSILGYQCDPAEQIDAAQLAPWLASGASVHQIGEQGIQDPSGYFDGLFEGLPSMLLVRSDRFVMAAFDASTAGDQLDAAAAMIGV